MTMQHTMRWVSLSERYPKTNQWVLCPAIHSRPSYAILRWDGLDWLDRDGGKYTHVAQWSELPPYQQGVNEDAKFLRGPRKAEELHPDDRELFEFFDQEFLPRDKCGHCASIHIVAYEGDMGLCSACYHEIYPDKPLRNDQRLCPTCGTPHYSGTPTR